MMAECNLPSSRLHVSACKALCYTTKPMMLHEMPVYKSNDV
jgi:hypothetical protein